MKLCARLLSYIAYDLSLFVRESALALKSHKLCSRREERGGWANFYHARKHEQHAIGAVIINRPSRRDAV